MKIALFPSFFDHPTNIRFDEQESDEKIELVLRQHWFTNVGWIIGALLAFIAPALITMLPLQDFNAGLANLPSTVFVQGLIVWYMLILAFVIERFLYWYFNVYIVTNLHLVDINFYSLLNRSIVEVQINDVQSSKSKIQGFIQSIFNYGDVVIETAAENQRIDFTKVPFPDLVADRIQDLREKKAGGGI